MHDAPENYRIAALETCFLQVVAILIHRHIFDDSAGAELIWTGFPNS
jgi:hypothetical protein